MGIFSLSGGDWELIGMLSFHARDRAPGPRRSRTPTASERNFISRSLVARATSALRAPPTRLEMEVLRHQTKLPVLYISSPIDWLTSYSGRLTVVMP